MISRLYAVLGQKTGAEPPARRYRQAPVAAHGREDETGADPAERRRERPAFTGPAAAGMEAIALEDPSFTPEDFTRGARKAYEMIVTAFADGDRETLKQLVDQDVFDAYSDAIVARQRAGTEPLRLVRLRQARIIEASVDASHMARILVAFESDLSDGENLRQAKEIWTFKRSLRSDNPNWLLDEVTTAT